jgi:LPS-assembly lipoprotein
MKKIFSFILLLLLTANISSCGYQIRVAQEVNFKSISIDGGSANFTKAIKKKFKQSGVQIKINGAEKCLEIVNDGFAKEILSLSSKGRVKEYEINYKVTYRVKLQDGAWSSPIEIETNRDYTFDDTNIIAKTEEESRLIKGMQDQLIRTIVTQISVSK